MKKDNTLWIIGGIAATGIIWYLYNKTASLESTVNKASAAITTISQTASQPVVSAILGNQDIANLLKLL